jgi:glycine cleavage system H lipoate-binding protein
MFGHDFLSGYSAKILEYVLAVSYLVLFVGFWRYVQGAKKVAKPAMEAKPAKAAAGWFEVPAEVAFHPGHTWARMEADGTVAVGLDDFGHRLVGAVDGVRLPLAKAGVEQGEPAVTLLAGGKEIGLLSPVEGEVVATNAAAAEGEPYGAGWLFKVRPTNWKRSRAQLLDGTAAKEWIEEQARQLYARLSPEAVPMLQDGGVPVQGIAREIDPEHWDELAREFLRTKES